MRWAFQHVCKRSPTLDELAEYERRCTLNGCADFQTWTDLAASDPGEAKRIFDPLANPSSAASQSRRRPQRPMQTVSDRSVKDEPIDPVPTETAVTAPMAVRSIAARSRAPLSPEQKAARALLHAQLVGGPKLGAEVERAAQAAAIAKARPARRMRWVKRTHAARQMVAAGATPQRKNAFPLPPTRRHHRRAARQVVTAREISC
jgi:hypothetical protein